MHGTMKIKVGTMLLYNSAHPEAGYPELQLSELASSFG